MGRVLFKQNNSDYGFRHKIGRRSILNLSAGYLMSSISRENLLGFVNIVPKYLNLDTFSKGYLLS
jgi:hypothetical protein